MMFGFQDYDFRMVDHGIDQRRSMLRSPGHRRRSSATFVTKNRHQRERRRSLAREPQSNVVTASGAAINSTTHPPQSAPGPRNATGSPRSSMAQNSDPTTELHAKSKEMHNDHEPFRAMKAGDLRLDQGLSDLTTSMAALRFVPPSVRLGRGKKPG